MATADFIENRFWHSMMDSATTLGAAARVLVDPSDARMCSALEGMTEMEPH